jgi:hypothetical protein
VPLAVGAQSRDVAGRAVAVAEVLAHVHLDGVQGHDEHPPDELGRLPQRELTGEREHENGVDLALREQCETVLEGGQPRWRGVGVDHRHRVRVEGHHHRQRVQSTAACHDAGQQVLVPEVDAVEVADRHDCPGGVVEPDLVE